MQNSETNSANSANLPTDTGDNGDIPARTRAKRRIDAKTIASIARLCAKSLTESEACRLLKITPKHWFNWKSRHKRAERFAALLEEFRAGRIQDLIARVEKSADGEGMKQPDWRAAAFLLSVADKRFSTSGGASVETTVNNNTLLVSVGGDAGLRRMIEQAYAEVARTQLPAGQAGQQAALPAPERVEPMEKP